MAQTKRAFAAKPPSDKPDGAAPVDKPSGAAGPSADGDAASSEAKKIALAVGVALSRAWKSLGTEGRGSYEERAEQEKILVIRDVQAAARRAGPGEGGLAKLREAIEAFAHKQPEQFVQLHERLVADEQSYLVRQQREQQRLRQKEEREAAEAYKQRYPIADELLRLEPPPPVPLAPRPSPRFGVNLPPELQRAAGLQLMIVEFVHTFSGWLRLAPFSMEELRGALLQRAPTVLLTELLLALLLPLLQEELAPLAEGGPPPEVDAEAAREALALSDGVRGPVPLLSRRLPMREASSLREASTAEALRWLLVRRGVTAAAEPEVAAALRALGAREAWELPMWEKLCLLCWLCDEVVGSEAMRKQLQANLEARVELQAAEAKAETERRAVARQEVQAAKEAAAAREAAAKEAEEEGGEEGGANPKPAKKAKAAKKAAAAGAGTNAGTGAGTSAAAVVAPTAPAAAAAGEEESGVTLPPDDEYDYGEAEADEDEDEEVEEEGKKVGRGRAMKRQREKATAARRDKLHMLKKRREKALERLHEATEKEDLPQLNEAMRLVQGAQLEGTRGGVKWRFPELSAALQLVEALQKREQALESIRARRDAVARLPLRTEPLGVDRDRTRYWRFHSELGRLYVEAAAVAPRSRKQANARQRKSAFAMPSRGTGSPGGAGGAGGAAGVAGGGGAARPGGVTTWRYHRSREEAVALLGSLDERGHNELGLKRVLDAEWSCLLEELANEREVPPVSDEWRYQGPHVGSRVSLHFDGLGASEGVVTRYLPLDADEPALWHVVHDDGDEEDLEEGELLESIGQLTARPADGLQDCVGAYAQWLNLANEPKVRVSLAALGLAGLRAEMRRLQEATAAAMHDRGSAWRGGEEGAPGWLAAVAQAGGPQCGELLLLLEEQMHVLQRGSNESDEAVEGGGGGAAGDEPRLWPSLEAREHWRDFAERAPTTAQQAHALHCLRDHAAAFGLLGKKEARPAMDRCSLMWLLTESAGWA